MVREQWIAELRELARRVELSGQPHIANSMKYDADRLEMIVEKTKNIKSKKIIICTETRKNL